MHDMQEVSELPEYLQEQIYTHMKLSLLATVPLLKSAPRACAATIATKMARILVPPQEYLMRQDEEGGCMFFVVRGIVEVLRRDEGGVDKLERTVTEGSWLGEAALFDEAKRDVSARAMTLCTLFRLDKKTFRQVCPRGGSAPAVGAGWPARRGWSSVAPRTARWRVTGPSRGRSSPGLPTTLGTEAPMAEAIGEVPGCSP